MEPTLHDGDIVIGNPFSAPKVNDVIVFDCLADRCKTKDGSPTLVKRIIQIDDQGCYWIEGDNKDNSTDSRKYGWLCPSEIGYTRVVMFKL